MKFTILVLAGLALASAADVPTPCSQLCRGSPGGPQPSACPSACTGGHPPTSSSVQAPVPVPVPPCSPDGPRPCAAGCYRPRSGLVRRLGHEGACESQTFKPNYRTAYVCDGGRGGLPDSVCCSDPPPSATRYGSCQRVSGEEEDGTTVPAAGDEGGADEEAVDDNEGLDASPEVAAPAGVDSRPASLEVAADCTPDRYKICCSDGDCQKSSYGTVDEAGQAIADRSDLPGACCDTKSCDGDVETVRGDCPIKPSASCFTPANEFKNKTPQEACATHKSKKPAHADLRTAYECTGTDKVACCKGGDTIKLPSPRYGTCHRIGALDEDYFDSGMQHAAVE